MVRTVSLLIVMIICTALILVGCAEPQRTAGQPAPTQVKRVGLQSSLDERYEDPQRLYDLGQMHRRDSQWVPAEAAYSVALQFEPGYKQSQAAMVKMNLERGDKDASKLLADTYISQSSNSAEALLHLGQAFMGESLDDYAYECFDKASLLEPDSAATNRELGYYYKKKGDAGKAEAAFKRSFQLNPYDSGVAGELGKMGVIVEVPKAQN